MAGLDPAVAETSALSPEVPGSSHRENPGV